MSLSPDRFSDGEWTVGSGPGNSAVETVPTPEENPDLLAYFQKTGILNALRPANLAARYFAQKRLQAAGSPAGQGLPVPAGAEIKPVLLTGKGDCFFGAKKRDFITAMLPWWSRGYPLWVIEPPLGISSVDDFLGVSLMPGSDDLPDRNRFR